MNISAVRVEGATHTRKSFLSSIIAPALSTDDSTLEEVLHTTRRISHALKKTDIFSSVEPHVDRPRSNLASPGDVDLVFKTRERGRWYVSSATEVGNNEGSAVRLSALYFLIFFFSNISRAPLPG
jgi:outer membrane protein insertion porin family